MFGIITLISSRLNYIDFSNPLTYIDMVAAITLIIAFLVYLSRFPVFRVFLGILFLLICSLVFLLGGFVFTALVFGIASNLILISLPLIFAPEIRHYLEKLGRLSFLKIPKLSQQQKEKEFIRNLLDSVYEMAERKIGGLIVIARKTGLGETIETGIVIDAKFGSKLLQNIFFPKNPLHDGAIVVKDGRIMAARCLLPISGEVKLDPPLGTRHKSAIAITKDTDAVVVVISEQRGEVSLAENGKLHINLLKAEMIEKLNKLL